MLGLDQLREDLRVQGDKLQTTLDAILKELERSNDLLQQIRNRLRGPDARR